MKSIFLAIAAGCALLFFAPHAAQAQATRTWISGVGDDANPCSRTSPCKTFAGAISKTTAGGEIDCLDPGGFGALTITKAITLDCASGQGGQVGSILSSGAVGINVVAGSTDKVVIRNLAINGTGPTLGTKGINFTSGASLRVENVEIQDVSQYGIIFNPSANASLLVADTSIGDSPGAVGIEILPSGAANVTAVIKNVRVYNSTTGVRGNGTAGTGQMNINVQDSVSAKNAAAGINLTAGTLASAQMKLYDVASSQNGTFGLRVDGNNATVRFGDSTFTGNGTGTSTNNGGHLASYGNNRINGNTVDGPAPPTIPTE